MLPSTDTQALVRLKLAETIPEGGTDGDTLISNADLITIIQGSKTLNEAILEGWEIKLAYWSNLVDVTDGAASRKLGDLIKHAETMIAYYTKRISLGPGARLGRTRIGKIVRNG